MISSDLPVWNINTYIFMPSLRKNPEYMNMLMERFMAEHNIVGFGLVSDESEIHMGFETEEDLLHAKLVFDGEKFIKYMREHWEGKYAISSIYYRP